MEAVDGDSKLSEVTVLSLDDWEMEWRKSPNCASRSSRVSSWDGCRTDGVVKTANICPVSAGSGTRFRDSGEVFRSSKLFGQR